MATIDEIVVIGKRKSGKINLADFQDQITQGQDFQDELDRMDEREERRERRGDPAAAGALYAAERKVAEKMAAAKPVIEKLAVKPVDPFIPKPKFLPVLYNPDTIPEIIVKAKRLPRVTSFLSRAAWPLTFAEVGGQLLKATLREAGRQAFDELGEKVTRTIPARPDTPVKTIPKPVVETIPEIIVTAKRRPRATQLAERVNIDMMSDWFNREMLRSTLPTRSTAPQTTDIGTVSAPTLPRLASQTRTITDTITQLASRTLQMTLPATRTVTRRSTLLGIGTGTASSVASITNVGLSTVPITQSKLQIVTRVGQKTKYCTPCPRRKKQKRKKCYRQLVKQGLYPSRDKISKWAQIDCVTGKTIKEL